VNETLGVSVRRREPRCVVQDAAENSPHFARLLRRLPARSGAIRRIQLEFPNKRVLQFDFDVIDLGRMSAENYVKLPNPAALALAARMKFDVRRRIRLTRDFFVNLSKTPLSMKVQELVAGFFSAYQALNKNTEAQRRLCTGVFVIASTIVILRPLDVS
jgi:hypothetical protein